MGDFREQRALCKQIHTGEARKIKFTGNFLKGMRREAVLPGMLEMM